MNEIKLFESSVNNIFLKNISVCKNLLFKKWLKYLQLKENKEFSVEPTDIRNIDLNYFD